MSGDLRGARLNISRTKSNGGTAATNRRCQPTAQGRQRLSMHCESEHFADTWSALIANVRYSPESLQSDGSNLDARMTAMWL